MIVVLCFAVVALVAVIGVLLHRMAGMEKAYRSDRYEEGREWRKIIVATYREAEVERSALLNRIQEPTAAVLQSMRERDEEREQGWMPGPTMATEHHELPPPSMIERVEVADAIERELEEREVLE